MNMKFVKRIFAVSMAATIMVAPIFASAATKTAEEIAAEKAEAQVQEIHEKTVESTTAVVNGKTISTNVAGTVDVTNSKSIDAFVLNSAGEKTPGEKQTVYSKTAKESPAAFESANGAAAAIGGTVIGDALNADIELKNGGTAEIVLKDAPEGTVKIIQVGDGGSTKVLDATVDGKAISFTPENGHFTYFVVVL